ncbi:hypothetical protein [Gillisia limnaea]|uniref:Lipoprotein n=1 Tax=Gillisia limnaea (strain DSM 15749 / LMG 21470 / R-8282) TaxID=865937 RepID=H2BTF7_GILLR|nr:hypothetical protein [Gillisia limnaea]EHQ01543.1 hypothetical protein Gilli_0847 [Gillisia limnaea DSM 15749]
MKKVILTIAIISAFLISCKDSKSTEAKDVMTEEKAEESTQSTPMDNTWVNEIKLDDGSKWQANLETTQGVAKMLDLIKSSNPKTLEDYHSLASKLNEEKNFIVKECTMKGASHDNLHIFLVPLIEKIEALSNTSALGQATMLTYRIEENLKGYYKYFQ